MWYVFGVTLWLITYFDICQPDFGDISWLHRRPKTISPDQTIITSSPSTKTYYNPNPGYDAYWTDGHWIFGTTTTKPTFSTSTRTRPMVCKKPCGIEYRYVGYVCAQMVNNTNVDFTIPATIPRFSSPVLTDLNYPHFVTFATYCEFLQRQCNDTVWNYMSWVFVHYGKCVIDAEVYLPVENDTDIYERKLRNLNQYKNDLKKALELRTKMERLRRQGKLMKLDANWIRKNSAFRIILNRCCLRGVLL